MADDVIRRTKVRHVKAIQTHLAVLRDLARVPLAVDLGAEHLGDIPQLPPALLGLGREEDARRCDVLRRYITGRRQDKAGCGLTCRW